MIKSVMIKSVFFLLGLVCCGLFPLTIFGQSLLPNVQNSQSFTRPVRQSGSMTQRPSAAPPVASNGGWYCLLFAAEQYDEASQNLPPLRGCYNDMVSVRTDWLYRIGVDGDRVVFLNDRNPHALPNRRNFLDQLEVLCQNADASTTLLVAVSSHGVAKNGKSYICPIDVTYQSASMWDNLIPVSHVIDSLKASKAGRKLLIIDTCRTAGDTENTEDFMSEFTALSKEMSGAKSTSGLAVITSCSLAQEAHEMLVDGQPRGVFMKYFIEGLAGPADYMGVIDGRITLSEAYAYAFSQTSKFVYLCRHGQQQTPELFRENSLTSFVLARSEPAQKRADETDMQFLLRKSMMLAARGAHSLATDVLTHIIANEPNNNIAVACRAGTFLAVADYSQAMNDFTSLGRTLDLYLQFSAADNKAFQAEIDKLKTVTEKEVYAIKNRKIRVMADKDAASSVRAELQPGQKVSISGIDGVWHRVSRIDDNVTQDGVGWIHKDNLTWTPEKVEQYRPQTSIHLPSGSREDKIGGLNFRQQSGLSGGGTGRATMGRTIGGGGI